MKNLNNYIFSKTTCISKEIMLKCINKKLSKDELYEVEKHMLDCDLCSDAYEGMQFAENSSILFTLDNRIEQGLEKEKLKTPLLKKLMVAASILIICFGVYFTIDYYNIVVEKESELAINEIKLREKTLNEVLVDSDLKEEIKTLTNKSNELEIVNSPIEEERKTEALPKSLNEEIFVEESDISNYSNLDLEGVELEEEDLTLVFDDALVEEESFIKLEESAKDLTISNKETRTVAKKRSADKMNKGMVSQAQVKSNSSAVNEKLKSQNDQRHLITIYGYKIFDYREEYQKKYDLELASSYMSNGVSAGFESEKNKDSMNIERVATTLEVTYQETIEKGIKLYKNHNYEGAIAEFDMILVKHPKDINAQFYKGLCFFYEGQNNLAIGMFNIVLENKQTEFNEEANWYKALTLIKMKNTSEAKKILKRIIKNDGFYKYNALEKLEEL